MCVKPIDMIFVVVLSCQ